MAASIIDTLDHNGLRGVMSLWIVCHHSLSNTEYPIDLEGSSLLPMFFLLSGFALTVGYYKKLIGEPATASLSRSEGTSLLANSISKADDSIPLPGVGKNSQEIMSWVTFIINRLIRVLPVYYICNLLAIPSFYAGFGVHDPTDTTLLIESYVTTIIPSSTWFGYYLGNPFDVPAWTIQTLIAMWMMFPFLLRWLHSKSDVELLFCIRWCFWLQLVIIVVVTFTLKQFISNWEAVCFGRFHPLSRIWCFIMGMAAGILCLRYKEMGTMPWFDDAHWFLPVKPWWDSVRSWFTPESSATPVGFAKVTDAIEFEGVMFFQTYVILTATLLVSIAEAIDIYVFSGDGVQGGTWFQGLVPFMQLNILIAMVRHKSPENLISTFLRNGWMQWIGDLSMSIYLVHYPIVDFILWLRYGKTLSWPSETDCSVYDTDDSAYSTCESDNDTYEDATTWPLWTILVLPPLAIFAAMFLFYFVEKPMSTLKA